MRNDKPSVSIIIVIAIIIVWMHWLNTILGSAHSEKLFIYVCPWCGSLTIVVSVDTPSHDM